MGFGHEGLDVDHAVIDYVGWAYHFCEELKGQNDTDTDSDSDSDRSRK